MVSPGKKAFLIRVDPELWAELERLAGAELRSVNGQIEYLLRESVTRHTGRTLIRRTGEANQRAKARKG